MNPPPQKFLPGTLVKGIPFANDYIQHPMIGIIICESDRSNWWGDIYTVGIGSSPRMERS
jgi:hypothetical protein